MSVFYEFDDVDGFTVGTIGRPGERVFYVLVRCGAERVSVRCEKQQVAAIAQYLQRALVDLPPPEDRPLPAAMEADPLHYDELFVLGPVGLGYDRSNDRILIQFEEIAIVDAEGEPIEDDRGHLRVFVTRGQAESFAARTNDVVESGRPQCQWCAGPIDPDGHDCPRMN